MTPDAAVPAWLRAARAADLDAVLALLSGADLPSAGVRDCFDRFVVAERDGAIVGAAGTERYGDSVLLRSVVVEPGEAGHGLGRALVDGALELAGSDGARDAYLLTMTADGWFPRLGFRIVTRDDVPVAVRASVEFTDACPSTAVVMHRTLA